MSSVSSVELSQIAGSRSSIFFAPPSGKRDLWWAAFRRTVLDPHKITIDENAAIEMVPQELLSLVEMKYDDLDRHEEQAITFIDAVASGQGFGTSPIFPPDILPALPEGLCLSRCLESLLSNETTPPCQVDRAQCPFEIPQPRPSLASGFSEQAFSEDEMRELPTWSAATGCFTDYSTGQILPGRTIYLPFLLFERTYGNARHELEASANYCAINGSAAVNAIKLLHDHAWDEKSSQNRKSPVVFTCIVDDDLAIINHHWISADGTFSMAPLCKFDFRDLEHFMHFLAWVEAIEEWAMTVLFADIQQALRTLADERASGAMISIAKALPSPVTDAEKQEKLSHSMRMAFENIPWKGERARNTPLGATMRMRASRTVGENGLASPPPEPPTSNNAEEQEHLSVSMSNARSPSIASPKTILASSPPPTAPFPQAMSSPPTENFSRSMPNSPAAKPERKKRIPAAISAIKSAGLSRSATTSPAARPGTATEFQTSNSTSTLARPPTLPVPRAESTRSPAIVESTIEMKSPSRSIISIQSKKSFMSLRSSKSLRSPGTPDSATNASPRGAGLKFKLSSSLDVIKERTTPKRTRGADNSAPSTGKEIPLPTPAYDKKRFEIRAPQAPIPPTPKFWDQQALQAATSNSSATAAAYNASHVLPLRQYTKSPTFATVTTTITAGGGQ